MVVCVHDEVRHVEEQAAPGAVAERVEEVRLRSAVADADVACDVLEEQRLAARLGDLDRVVDQERERVVPQRDGVQVPEVERAYAGERDVLAHPPCVCRASHAGKLRESLAIERAGGAEREAETVDEQRIALSESRDALDGVVGVVKVLRRELEAVDLCGRGINPSRERLAMTYPYPPHPPHPPPPPPHPPPPPLQLLPPHEPSPDPPLVIPSRCLARMT